MKESYLVLLNKNGSIYVGANESSKDKNINGVTVRDGDLTACSLYEDEVKLPDYDLVILTKNGFGKRIKLESLSSFKIFKEKRQAKEKGKIFVLSLDQILENESVFKVTEKTGDILVGIVVNNTNTENIRFVLQNDKKINIPLTVIPYLKASSSGVKLVKTNGSTVFWAGVGCKK